MEASGCLISFIVGILSRRGGEGDRREKGEDGATEIEPLSSNPASFEPHMERSPSTHRVRSGDSPSTMSSGSGDRTPVLPAGFRRTLSDSILADLGRFATSPPACHASNWITCIVQAASGAEGDRTPVLLSAPSERHPNRIACGAEGDRTPDLLHAMQAFSQLNYRPTLDSNLPTKPGGAPQRSKALTASAVRPPACPFAF